MTTDNRTNETTPERWRKKPVEIEAMRYDGENWVEIAQWLRVHDVRIGQTGTRKASIPTLEGTMYASPGDWIIKGVQGEFYPCKPDIFEQTYERAALVAAQGAAPVPVVDESTPSEDDLALKIAHEIAKMHTFTTVDALSIANAALALSAPPILTQQGPSDEQVEAAAHALWAGHGLNGEWESGTHEMHEDCREDARNALIAAASVAAQPLDNTIHDRIQPRTQPEREAWDDGFHSCRCAAPVLPSSGVDEDALAEVIGSLDWGYMVDGPSVREIARAVAEWLKGLGGESSGG